MRRQPHEAAPRLVRLWGAASTRTSQRGGAGQDVSRGLRAFMARPGPSCLLAQSRPRHRRGPRPYTEHHQPQLHPPATGRPPRSGRRRGRASGPAPPRDRREHRVSGRPTEPQAALDGHQPGSRHGGPLSSRPRHAVNRQVAVGALVVGLLLPRRPTDVPRFVVPVLVRVAVQGVFQRRPLTKVGEKVGEAVSAAPTRRYRDGI